MAGKRFAEVLGRRMAYVDTGGPGGAVVFLHGNPTSSYLWRNVIPHLADRVRCVAPDLVGMGDSDPLPDSGPDRYRFVEHREHLDALLDTLDLGDRVTIVGHDWGSALGFDWASRHRDRILGIAYLEAVVRPLTWEEWPEASRKLFQGFRSDAGEGLILERNLFVERVLPASMQRTLSDEEMAEYRRPFAEAGERRRPTLTWPRQIPIDGEPADMVAIVASYAEWLSESPVPKLFVNAEPGAILTGAQREFCRSWPNQQEVTVAGIHFLQEDSPHEIGAALAEWHRGL